LVEIFNRYYVDFEFEKIGFEDYEINDSQAFAKYIRNRITSSDFSQISVQIWETFFDFNIQLKLYFYSPKKLIYI